jgi:hypothetical protein
MLQLLPAHIIPSAQWEYDAVNIDSVPVIWSHTLQYLLAVEANYQHGQILSEIQVQEIKDRHVEVWQEELDGAIPEEVPMPHFISGSGTEEDPYIMNYSSWLLTNS